MQITISVPDEAYKMLEKYRKEKYPHLKKVSRMMLQIVMDKINEEK